jgi:hypothetical protein
MDKSWNLDKIIEVMRAGGYYDRIMSGGPELDRVKTYLRIFAGEQEEERSQPLQFPNYPCFPGLSAEPFYSGSMPEGVKTLEAEFETIRDEALAVSKSSYLRYAPEKMTNDWYLYLLFHMGVDMSELSGACPKTQEILRSLPRLCVDYPWGDAALSLNVPDSHLHPHCSVDNLRMRCHLAIEIPDNCGIRVGSETRGWEQGKAIIFDDSFEHEVWNRGRSDRIVMIVDFWHPELTDIEVRALSAGFRKSEVRKMFYSARIYTAENPESHLRHLEHEIAKQDADPLILEYWD